MSTGERKDGPRPLDTRWTGLPLVSGEYVIYDVESPKAWVQSTHAIDADDAA